MKTILAIWLLCTAALQPVLAQTSISQSVFAVAGHTGSSSQLTMSSTLGETFIFGGSILSVNGCQGFQSGVGVISTRTIESGQLSLEVQYFPNPTHEGLTITWDKPGEYHFLLLSTMGQIVRSYQANTSERELYFDLLDLSSGVYAIFIDDHKQSRVAAGWITYIK